jgi:hypothetical protein
MAHGWLYSFQMDLAYRTPATDRRLGLLVTVLVHVALLIGWQAVRTLPAPVPAADSERSRILWLPLPVPRHAPQENEPPPPRKETALPRPRVSPGAAISLPPLPQIAPVQAPAESSTAAPAASLEAPAQAAPASAPSARQMLEQAKRDIGKIDKALRKENNPYIAAPLDSPQIRLRRGIEQAAAMAPTRIWEAPKVEDLVNDTGDGARRSRVITGLGTYCVTDRSPATSIDMIEKHGKQRITSCPQHEQAASKQAWRTLRD